MPIIKNTNTTVIQFVLNHFYEDFISKNVSEFYVRVHTVSKILIKIAFFFRYYLISFKILTCHFTRIVRGSSETNVVIIGC